MSDRLHHHRIEAELANALAGKAMSLALMEFARRRGFAPTLTISAIAAAEGFADVESWLAALRRGITDRTDSGVALSVFEAAARLLVSADPDIDGLSIFAAAHDVASGLGWIRPDDEPLAWALVLQSSTALLGRLMAEAIERGGKAPTLQ